MALVAPAAPRVPLVYVLTKYMSHDALRDMAKRYRVPTERSQEELARAMSTQLSDELEATANACDTEDYDQVVARAEMDYGIRNARHRLHRSLCTTMWNSDRQRAEYDLYKQAVGKLSVEELCADKTLREATPLETLRDEAVRRGIDNVGKMSRAALCRSITQGL